MGLGRADERGQTDVSTERRYEIGGIVILAITTLLFLALFTDGYEGQVRRPIDGMASVPNALGQPGAVVAGVLFLCFGRAAHLIYCVTGVWGFMLLRHIPLDRIPMRALGLVALLFGVALLFHVDGPLLSMEDAPVTFGRPVDPPIHAVPVPLGGVFGGFSASLVTPHLGLIGTNIIAVAIALIGLILTTEFTLLRFVAWLNNTIWAGLLGILVGFRAVGRTFSAAFAFVGSTPAPAYPAPADAGAAAETRPSKRSPRIRVRPPRDDAFGNDDAAQGAPRVLARQRELPFPAPPVSPVDPIDDEATPPDASELAHPVDPGLDAPFALEDDRDPIPPPRADAAPDVTAPDPPITVNQPFLPDAPIGEAEPVDADVDDTNFDDLDLGHPGFDDAPQTEIPAEENDETPPAAASANPEGRRNGSSSPAPRASRGKPLPRRKTVAEQELPPDYVYPKRYTRPPIDLFDSAPPRLSQDMTERLLKTSARLEETLRTFGIEASVTEVTRGPTITRFELEPAPGIKVSRFVALADDLALALRAHRVRVEAPIPGKGRVGIEVPNAQREPVVIRELLESRQFHGAQGKLSLALGKDIAGEVQVADLATMPHLLVAGATGAGKTVAVKTMIASLLYSHTPDELQLMFVDPKMVELSIFNDIPHLITPVVTDPKKAAASLRWLITEMEERYRLFSHLRVRNIEVYNESVENGEIEMPDDEESGGGGSMDVIRKLPYIVCIIDELADLMMLARADVEDAIARLAQLARAVGIHLIIATQRPSVDVLTGVIKANFPARLSFQVSSKVDSRCILDQIGAERLIGRGDMLYLPAGLSKPVRIQGAFVSDDEMNGLISYLKTQAPPQYRDEIQKYGNDKESLESFSPEEDDLFDDAVRVVLETGQASISMVQRRLRVGYTRAARLIDMMEMRGIVGPHIGSKAREILVELPPDDKPDDEVE